MKLLIAFALVALAAAVPLTDEKTVFDDTPVVVDETPVVNTCCNSPVVLPEAPEPLFEHVDIRLIMVPESVIEELKLGEVIDSVKFVDNTVNDEVPVNTVHVVDFAENTGFEPIAPGELETVRVSQDEYPLDGLSQDTVHVIDVPVINNPQLRYPDSTWR